MGEGEERMCIGDWVISYSATKRLSSPPPPFVFEQFNHKSSWEMDAECVPSS